MKQVRFIPIESCGLQVREAEDGKLSRVVVGRPIVFGVRSVNITPLSSTRIVYEVLERGCVTQDLINRSDIVYNNNHSERISDMLGRCRNGKGTLSISLREGYVESSCELPNTTNANDTLELIKRGDVYGMSFAFQDDYEDTENGVSYERTGEIKDGKEVWVRHVKRITKLYDVANVTRPAYTQTNLATREESDAIDHAIDEQLKREAAAKEETAEEREAREQQEREANGGETNAEKAAREEREAQEREANGGETNAEKAAREEREAEEARELEEQEQRFREQRAMRQRAERRRCEIDLESLIY